MKVNGKLLNQALTKCLRVKNKNAVLPILESVHVKLAGGWCYLTCTDLETTVITKIPVTHSSEEIGEFTLSERAYTMLLQLKDADSIEIIHEDAGKVDVVHIMSHVGRMKTITEQARNYPQTKVKEMNLTFTWPTKDFVKQLNLCKRFTSPDDMRPAMTGVYITNKVMVATDAHRLIEMDFKTGLNNRMSEFKIIVCKTFIHALTGLADETTTITLNADQIIATDKDTTVISRLIDARYPDYKVVVPTESTYQVTMSRKEILHNLKFAMMVCDMQNKCVRFSFTSTGYRMIAYDSDLSDEVILNGSCLNMPHGATLDIAFNGQFLREQLEMMPDDDVTFEMNTSEKCVVFHTPGLCLLLMPLIFPSDEDVAAVRAKAKAEADKAAAKENVEQTVTEPEEELQEETV